MGKISVILPTYNEEGNIGRLLSALSEELKDKNVEYIVVDDYSKDRTVEEVEKVKREKNLNVRLLIRKTERGLASAIKRGIELAEGDIIVMMDTDFNHPPSLVPKLLECLKNHDACIGSRYVKGGGMDAPRFRYIGSKLFNIFVEIMLKTGVRDNLSGFAAFKKNLLDGAPLDRIFQGYGDFFIRFIFYLKKKGASIKEIPVFYAKRESGVSKTNFLKHLPQYTRTVLSLRVHGI